MEVGKIVASIKEYEQLQGLIDNINNVLSEMEPREKTSELCRSDGMSVTYCDPAIYINQQIRLDVDLTKLISNDLKTLLEVWRDKLELKRNSMEI